MRKAVIVTIASFLIHVTVAEETVNLFGSGNKTIQCQKGSYLVGFFGGLNDKSGGLGIVCGSKNSDLTVNRRPYPTYPTIMRRSVCQDSHGVIALTARREGQTIQSLIATCSDGVTAEFGDADESNITMSKTAQCNAGTVVTGIKLNYNPSLTEGLFDSLAVICSASRVRYDDDKGTTILKAFGSDATKMIKCPHRYFAVGIRGTADESIKSLGLLCADYQSGATSQSVPSEIGTAIGTPAKASCAFGHFLRGFSGSGNEELRGLKGSCYDGTHTGTIGKDTSGIEHFTAGCKVGHGVVGIKLGTRTSQGITGLAVVCSEPPLTPYQAPSPSPAAAVIEPDTSADIIARAQSIAVQQIQADFIGVVSMKTPSASCELTAPINLDFHQVESISESLVRNTSVSNSSTSTAEIPRTEALSEACGDLPIKEETNECIWNTRDLLGVLYEEGIFLMRSGASPSVAFSMYIHAVNVAWNRVNCVKGNSITEISLPPGYEGLYGILAAKIKSVLQKNGDGGIPAPLSAEQNEKLQALLMKAQEWDVGYEVPPTLFPSPKDVPEPLRVLEPESNVMRISTSAARFTNYKLVTAEDCDSQLFFKEEYIPTFRLPLVHTDQHCCSNVCLGYTYFARHSGSSSLSGCCRLCNKFSCSVAKNEATELYTATASIVQSPGKHTFAEVRSERKNHTTEAAVYVFIL